MESEIRNQVMELISDKLRRIFVSENEISGSFDLVKTGLMNSLEFVDLVASLEKMNGIEIDFETALEKGDFTTLGGLIKAFKK